MKFEIFRSKTVEVTMLRMRIPVRYGTEDIPEDFPGRTGDILEMTIDLDKHRIDNWPKGRTEEVYMKVVDEGFYYLLDTEGNEIAAIEQDYVPNGLIPGEYGDYIELNIDETGTITNWPKNPDTRQFKATRRW